GVEEGAGSPFIGGAGQLLRRSRHGGAVVGPAFLLALVAAGDCARQQESHHGTHDEIPAHGHPTNVANSSLVRAAAARRACADGPTRSTSRDDDGTTWRAAAPKTRRTSSGVAPWAPTPGARIGPLKSNRSATSPTVAPMTAPKDPTGSASRL